MSANLHIRSDLGGNKGPPALVVCIFFTSLAAVVVILRLVTRISIVRNVGLEDWLVTVALCCSIALTALIADEVRLGMGRHYESLSPGEFMESLKPFWASVPVYNLSLVLIKCSILVQYLRIFVGKAIRRTCKVLLIIIAAYGTFTVFGATFMCLPVSYFWDKSINGKCMNEMAFWFSNASINIVSDIAILITPIPVLKSLQIPRRQKIGLSLVFAVGAFACVTSILRLRSLYVISVSTDITWDNVGAATWSSVEANVGIICSCLPILRPFFTLFFPRLLGNSTLRTNTENGGNYNNSRYKMDRMPTGASITSKAFHSDDSDTGTGFKNNISFGLRHEKENPLRESEEGGIKVVRVVEVQHQAEGGKASARTSETSLVDRSAS